MKKRGVWIKVDEKEGFGERLMKERGVWGEVLNSY
jgi:hypothetical protein